jgi:hypothetical protein
MSRFSSAQSRSPKSHATWQPMTRAKHKNARETSVESVIDDFMVLERSVGAQRYADAPHQLDDLKQKADLVMHIKERAQEIENDARERAVSRNLEIVERLLPIGLTILAAVLIVALFSVVLISMDRAEFDELLRWLVSLGGAPIGTGIALLGGGSFAMARRLKRVKSPTGLDGEPTPTEGSSEE